MAFLYKDLKASSDYHLRYWKGSVDEYYVKLAKSTTIYVGNLSFYTTEEQIWELFSKVGEVKRIIMGLDRNMKTPCGFCFVEYYTHEAASDCVNYISGLKLDDRPIRADWDTGFEEGRQFGRGKSGGQVRDEYRVDYDAERGGYGKRVHDMVQRGDLNLPANGRVSSDQIEDALARIRGGKRRRGSGRFQDEEWSHDRFRDDEDVDGPERDAKRSRAPEDHHSDSEDESLKKPKIDEDQKSDTDVAHTFEDEKLPRDD